MDHRPSFGRDVKALLKKLLLGKESYFSKGRLNSEGRKVFEEAARMLIYEHPHYKAIVKRARRTGGLEDVLKIAKLVLGEEESRVLILSSQLSPYREKVDYMIEKKLSPLL